MATDTPMTLADLFPLPEGVKLRTRRFGSAPPTELKPLPPDMPAGGTDDHPEFELTWHDEGLGLTVLVRERSDSGRLVARAFSTDPAHLDTAAVSVAVVGSAGDDMIRKTVLLDTAETVGPDKCSGTADFGPLVEARQRLGDKLGLVAFLLVSTV